MTQNEAGVCTIASDVWCTDDALRGLLAREDIALCCHSDGSPWLLGCGAHGKVHVPGNHPVARHLLIGLQTSCSAIP